MNQKLVKKAHELRSHGFTTGEIADELNVSMDTARWLTVQKQSDETSKNVPIDFAINWNSLGGSSSRLKYVSAALSDMALAHENAEVVVGIAVSGIPFATMMADFLETEQCQETSLAVFHPLKHRKGEESHDSDSGAISENFASVKGKRVIIVDDVITSGRTIKEVITNLKEQGAKPIAVTVLIDKVGISEVEGVPVESLIQVNRLE
jgi:orotate phosphoribosyltransferase